MAPYALWYQMSYAIKSTVRIYCCRQWILTMFQTSLNCSCNQGLCKLFWGTAISGNAKEPETSRWSTSTAGLVLKEGHLPWSWAFPMFLWLQEPETRELLWRQIASFAWKSSFELSEVSGSPFRPKTSRQIARHEHGLKKVSSKGKNLEDALRWERIRKPEMRHLLESAQYTIILLPGLFHMMCHCCSALPWHVACIKVSCRWFRLSVSLRSACPWDVKTFKYAARLTIAHTCGTSDNGYSPSPFLSPAAGEGVREPTSLKMRGKFGTSEGSDCEDEDWRLWYGTFAPRRIKRKLSYRICHQSQLQRTYWSLWNDPKLKQWQIIWFSTFLICSCFSVWEGFSQMQNFMGSS